MAKLSFADLNRAGVFSGFTGTADMSLKVEELEKNISAIKNNFSDRISNNEEKVNHLINTSKELLESNEKVLENEEKLNHLINTSKELLESNEKVLENEEKLNHLINTSKELLESNEKISVEIKEFRKSKKMIIILSSFALICVVISIVLQLVK